MDQENTIITHDGSAHLDDFLSCCIILHKDPTVCEIIRKEPTQKELDNPNIWKLDIGKTFDPERKIMDHHLKERVYINGLNFQVNPNKDSTISILLKYFNIWEKAIEVHTWLPTAVMLDVKGSFKVAKRLNIDSEIVSILDSFVQRSILQFFSQETIIKKINSLFKLMVDIGKHFFDSIDEYFSTKEQIENKIEYRMINNEIPIVQCLDVEITGSLERLLKEKKAERWPNVYGGVIVCPNNRPPGTIGLRTIGSETRINFRKLEGREGVLYTHHGGWFAVIENSEIVCDDLIDLLIRDSLKNST